MNNIECIINNRSYNIAIDKYKIIYGNNFDSKFNVYKCIKYYFNKLSPSDYGKENNNKALVKFNDRYLDIKDTLFFEMGYEYDYSGDAKLTTKSLILKYLEYALEGIEYEDTFNTVKELLYALINFELEDRVSINHENVNLSVENEDFNYKSLIKLLVPILTKDNLEINSLDIGYEESIILQIKLINKISIMSKKNIIVIANIPEMTNKVIDEINLLGEDVNMIIFSNSYNDNIPIESLILTDFGWLDLGSEEQVFEYIINSPFTSTVEAFTNKLEEALKSCKLKKILYKK
ncbi:MAG: hypothetical protein IKJ30_04990 [Bacilli bacterium]|nr:hypothetical protein [Bacilli bacterium]